MAWVGYAKERGGKGQTDKNGKRKSSSVKTAAGLKNLLDYGQRNDKTDVVYVQGHNVDPYNAFASFMATKAHYNKMEGRYAIHLMQSFAKTDNVTPEMALEIGTKFIQHEIFKGFQIVQSVHLDKEHLHNHFVINSVNFETGKMYHSPPSELLLLQAHSDLICMEYGLSVIKKPKDNMNQRPNRGEFEAAANQRSWKKELFFAVVNSIRNSTSRETFIQNMNSLGYQVDWQDSRKYILFTTPSGKKCRNSRLWPQEKFTKEGIQNFLEMNKKYEDELKLKTNMEMLITAINLLPKEYVNIDGQPTQLPLTQLEGQAIKDEMIQKQKGHGFEWNLQPYER